MAGVLHGHGRFPHVLRIHAIHVHAFHVHAAHIHGRLVPSFRRRRIFAMAGVPGYRGSVAMPGGSAGFATWRGNFVHARHGVIGHRPVRLRRLHAAGSGRHAAHGVLRVLRGGRRRQGQRRQQGDGRSGPRAHATTTSRNMPASMW
ncbi:hypothetical protein [Frateuria sp. Soil773]|uniref:hypothetical protein n=1 Tax=Frateuria sp. Soil773 TaxID=1736407 RepID=UPI00138F1BC4|nr:hypothetical protein [Frateuria sp. Soil773]